MRETSLKFQRKKIKIEHSTESSLVLWLLAAARNNVKNVYFFFFAVVVVFRAVASLQFLHCARV